MYDVDRFDYANQQIWQAMNEFNSISGVINNQFPVRITRKGIEADTRQFDAMVYRLNAAELDREFKIEQELRKEKEHVQNAPIQKGLVELLYQYYTRVKGVLSKHGI